MDYQPMIKTDWTACRKCPTYPYPPANWKRGPVPEEMYQTLLTNKKQGKLN